MDEPAIKRRFGHLSKEQIDQKRDNVIPKATKHANLKSARALKAYLTEKGVTTSLECLEPEELATILESFYFDARTTTGDLYRRSSLENLRHGINRYLRSPPVNKEFDIIKDSVFRKANDNFRAALEDIKLEGKGDTQHFPAISDEDLQKLYASNELNTRHPRGLYNKVQFDIRYYFCRRGQENIRRMTKDSFKIESDSSGRRYVVKAKDELTKNHRGDDGESFSGFMPEKPGCSDCPVSSFEQYISHLHPECNALWQRPKDYSDVGFNDMWYYNAPVGEKTLSSFMKTLSIKAGLSRKYTNHSIRTTGATVLGTCGFQPAQVMSVTGHKSVNSLAQYQRVSSEEKLNMGSALSAALGSERSSSTHLGPRPISVMRLNTTTASSSMAMPPPSRACSSSHFMLRPSPGPGPSPSPQTSANISRPATVARQSRPTSSTTSTSGDSHDSEDVMGAINFDFTATELEEFFSSFEEPSVPRPIPQTQSQPIVFNNCTFSGNLTFHTTQ